MRLYFFFRFVLEIENYDYPAYKDISQVMALQSDLVKIKVELSPLAVIKG